MGQHGGDIYSEEIQKQIAKEDRKYCLLIQQFQQDIS